MGQGGPQSYLTGPAQGDPVDIALKYLQTSAGKYGLVSGDLDDLKLTASYETKHNGVTHIYLRQRFGGIEVFGGDVNLNVHRDGSIISLGNRLVTHLRSSVRYPPRTITAGEAVTAAAVYLGLVYQQPLRVLQAPQGPEQETHFAGNDISLEVIPVRLMFQPLKSGPVTLAWQLVIRPLDGLHTWNLRVDAQTGRVLDVNDWSAFDGYRVFPHPFTSPGDVGAQQVMVVDPASSVASPFGWHDSDGVPGAEFTDTRGNNVSAQEDTDGNNLNGFRPIGGEALLFDFPHVPEQPPSLETNMKVAVTNLFYWTNLVHDIHYYYGFDEDSGNFQENNYGHGGEDNDSVRADVQDGSGVNNATFHTPPDGLKPRLQMFLFTNPTRDSALDAGIIIHEYGHGLSNRLTGGPFNVDCLNGKSRAMGEGWSDWWALALTTRFNNLGSDPRGIGNYAEGQEPGGSGIRNYPYSTDMTIDPQTYGDIAHTNFPHGAGEIWGVALWEMYWNLVEAYGFDPDVQSGTGGNNRALQLVMDALKLQPCNPTFLDGRDALLLADQINNGGADRCLIWRAFAKRGMGISADDRGNNFDLNVVENFQAPPDCLCEAPAAPLDLVGTAVGDNRVNLSWPPSPGAGSYNLYRIIGSCPSVISELTPVANIVTGTNYTDLGVSGGLDYRYVVTALDESGYCESEISPCAAVTPSGVCLTPPVFNGLSTVTNLGEAQCGLLLSWPNASVHCGTDVVYNLYRSTIPGFDPSPTTLIAQCLVQTSFRDERADFLVPYYYIVRAENNQGRGNGPCGGTEDNNRVEIRGEATGAVTLIIDDPILLDPPFWLTMPGPNNGGNQAPFLVTDNSPNSQPYAWFCSNDDGTKDQVLLFNRALDLPQDQTFFLEFRHRFHTENHFDGGVLEFSTDLGQTWFDILAGNNDSIGANEQRFLLNGYNDTLSLASALGARPAWTGLIPSYEKVIVDMSDFAGTTLFLRWRFGSDSSVGREGWWLDDIFFFGFSQCSGYCEDLDYLYRQWPRLDILAILECPNFLGGNKK